MKWKVYYHEWHDLIVIGPNKNELWSESGWPDGNPICRIITIAPHSAIKLIGEL